MVRRMTCEPNDKGCSNATGCLSDQGCSYDTGYPYDTGYSYDSRAMQFPYTEALPANDSGFL